MALNITQEIKDMLEVQNVADVRAHIGILEATLAGSSIAEFDFTASLPSSPTVNDAYIATVTGTLFGGSQSITAGNIYFYFNSVWNEIAATNGMKLYNSTQSQFQRRVGGAWIQDNTYDDTDKAKLAGIEAGADVTDAANVAAAGATMNTDADLSSKSYFLDEDNMASDSAVKVPSQQSVKAYVDAQIAGVGGSDGGFSNFDFTTQSALTSTQSISWATGNGKRYPITASSADITITLSTAAVGAVSFYRTDATEGKAVSITLDSGSINPNGSTIQLYQNQQVSLYCDGTNVYAYSQSTVTSPLIAEFSKQQASEDARYTIDLPKLVVSGTFDFDASANLNNDLKTITNTTTSNTPFSIGGNNWALDNISNANVPATDQPRVQRALTVNGSYPIELERFFNGTSQSEWYSRNRDFVSGVNDTGGSIPASKVVRLAYDSATDSRWEIAYAQANNSGNVTGQIGFLLATTADQAQGVVMSKGIIGGLDTSAFAIGDTVYLSDATQGLISTKPTAVGSYVVELGKVKTSHASTGEIYVDVKQVFGVPADEINNDADGTAVIKWSGLIGAARFDGTASSPTADNSYNCASISKVSTGRYKFNFTTAAADTNYIAVILAGNGTTIGVDDSNVAQRVVTGSYTTGYFEFTTTNVSGGAFVDAKTVNVLIFKY